MTEYRSVCDGPSSPLFRPLHLEGSLSPDNLANADLSRELIDCLPYAPFGECVGWGIPFSVSGLVPAFSATVETRWMETTARWFVCMHTADIKYPERNQRNFTVDPRGIGLLNEHVADYYFLFADGTEDKIEIRGRHQIGMVSRLWGQNCFQAVALSKPHPVLTTGDQLRAEHWGYNQTRMIQPDSPRWVNWLWAWENPCPHKPVVGLRIVPADGKVVLSAVSAGDAVSTPLRWERRRKAILKMDANRIFKPHLDSNGLSEHVQIDLGQVISASRRPLYPNANWTKSYNNQPPELSPDELIVEYAAHPDAMFHLPGEITVPVNRTESETSMVKPVDSAFQRVKLRFVEKESGKQVAVKMHIHGEAGEYLTPMDRNRIPNACWYEDWSVDYVNADSHWCTYVDGETTVDLPIGRVYLEVSKGFEIEPIRKIVRLMKSTTELTFEIERILPWRENGWVTADTHVHFLSPHSARLEGAGEGVNVVNLLASQWGELMTNVGDFDGRTTLGSRESGYDGEWLVRVGTENRQHVLGHISLLGYNGPIIAPMTTGGPDESALGDPIEILLTEWARQCRRQDGVVILPHFPNPRAEHAAAIVDEQIHGVEMTAWGNLYAGIDPYSLSDWYRYLNCGYFVAAVGGTDKMTANTAVGAVRTYVKLPKNHEFDYDAWKEGVKSGNTFVTYGPLLEFDVEGKPAGSLISMKRTGGTVDVNWKAASVAIPMSRVELIANGELRESVQVDPREASGSWRLNLDRSTWVAILIRGKYRDRPEMIAAHSSPVMVEVSGKPFYSHADAVSILEQIEGSLAYLDTVGTRAETKAYRRMRLVLTSAHRKLHNRMHKAGVYHNHTVTEDHH